MSQATTETAIQAAREAFARGAWDEVRQRLAEAERTQPLAATDLELLAETEWWSGHPDQRDEAYGRAYNAYLDAGQRREAARIALHLAEFAYDRMAPSIGGGWFRRARRILLEEPQSGVHALAAAIDAYLAITGGRLDEGLQAADRAIDQAREFGDRDVEALGLNLKGRALLKQGQVAEAMALIDESAVAATSGELHPWATSNVYCSTIDACRDLADWQRAAEWTDEADREMRRRRIGGYPGICRVHRAELMRIRGTWPEAEQEARSACAELERFHMLVQAGWGYYEVGEVRMRMGDYVAAEEAFRKAYEFGRDPEPGLALLRLAQGETASAVSAIRRALSEAEGPGELSGDRPTEPLGRAHLLPAQVDIALAVGDGETANSAATELEEIAGHFGTTALHAAAATARGSVQLSQGDHTAAIATLLRARRLWQTVGAPYEGAQVRARLAEAYRAAGDEPASAQELEAARATFERLHATPDMQRVEELLAQAGSGRAPAAERTVKTFMFTDVVGSTDLIEAIGDEAWEELVRWHDATLRSLFARHGGAEVNHTGDGFFVAFDDARAAVESAVGIQRALTAHRRQHGFAPWVRIGLHTAEATHSGTTYRGMGVHAAARIGALADRDEILVSRDWLAAAGELPYPVSELRSATLKGIKDAVEVATLGWQ